VAEARKRSLGLALLAAGALIAVLPGLFRTPPAQAEGERLVLAFYYPWFDKNSWNSGKVSDLPLAPYNSDDRAAMARQVEQAQSAGIDAFVLNWWGKGNRTEKNLKALLDVAAERGFRVAVDFDLNSPVMSGVDSYVENLRYLHTVHAAHPAYLRYGGRPVVFFYNVTRLPVATWQSIRDQVDPERKALWIAEGTDLKYQSVFDGHHLYSITWPSGTPPSQTLSSWGSKVRQASQDYGSTKIWVATVMPGYDDRKARPGGGFAQPRDGGDYYRQCWEAAIASEPQWVIVNSFNEWLEGSYIEPSQAYGRQYLDLTRQWAAQFKSAGSAAGEALAPPLAPSPLPPTAKPPTPMPMPRTTVVVVEDERVVSQDSLLGMRCGYVRTEDGPLARWEVVCYSDPARAILLVN
jgi:hypothetical protein